MDLLIFNEHQLEACAYIFEIANGNTFEDFRIEVIATSQLPATNPDDLAEQIINGIESGSYITESSRGSAYWALSKRFDAELIPLFRKWLRNELKLENEGGLFQLMIALNNLDEPVFHKERSGFSSFEIELNYRDARYYLSNSD